MTIANFPAALVPAIQTGFLEREFRDGLRSNIVYRSVASMELFPSNVGETITKTRKGLKAPVTAALDPSTNTNLDNGLTPSGWTIEQYQLGVNMYGDTVDLNMVTQRVGIEDLFLHNARTNGMQAAQSIDRLARQALLDAYMSGNTRVRATNSGSQTYVDVDDVRGFQTVPVNGVMTAVSSGNPLAITVNGTAVNVTAVTLDTVNVSSVVALGGKSGRLTTDASVTQTDATANNAVLSTLAPTVLRPNARATTKHLTASDLFSMGIVLDAVTQLRNNAVPTVGGLYNCYLDNTSARQLFADPDFKQLFQGSNAAQEFRNGRVIELLDVRFLPTTEAVQQSLVNASSATVNVHRPIVCGEGALVEGVFDSTAYSNLGNNGAMVDVVEGIAMITRPSLDRLQQIIAQSWYYIGGFVCPTDVTATSTIIPTANSALFKRAVMIEHG